MASFLTSVKPKKALGQHFLKDLTIAERIASSYTYHQNCQNILEIGAGTGVLTQFLAKNRQANLKVIDVDAESIAYLQKQPYLLSEQIIEGDFLKFRLDDLFPAPFGIIGNFPYNVASQILFTVFENRDTITEVVCMIQKEVAERIASAPGKKTNGVLSIFLQAFYDVEYLFTVPPSVFLPPPKVDSAVIRLRRNSKKVFTCPEKQLITIVKQAFNQRRKTLRNSLRSIVRTPEILTNPIFDKRAEQLGVADFEALTAVIYGT